MKYLLKILLTNYEKKHFKNPNIIQLFKMIQTFQNTILAPTLLNFLISTIRNHYCIYASPVTENLSNKKQYKTILLT